MFKFKLSFCEKPRNGEPPSIAETSTASSDSDESCVMLSKRPIDLKLYSIIFRPSRPHLCAESASPPSMSYSNQFFINRVRSSYGLHELLCSRELDHLARHHAERLALRESLFPTCETLEELICHLNSMFVGENIQRGKSVRNIHDSMMACHQQQSNVLSPKFLELGIGICRGRDGMYYVVQLFRAEEACK